MNKIMMLLTLCVSSMMFAGCSTIEGFGKDVQAAGSAIEEKAEESK